MKFNNYISVRNCMSVEVNVDRPTVPLSQQTLIAITQIDRHSICGSERTWSFYTSGDPRIRTKRNH
jgi:hypothetical protein